ncbi:MAG: MFS transporter [Solirubrobacterales bacterium]
MLIALGAAYFFAFYDVVNIGDALPEIARQFDVSSATSAQAISIGLLGYVVGSLADSFVSDRLGRRLALTLSVVMVVIGALITAFSESFTMLLIGRFISGMGIGAEIASAAAYLNGIAPSRLRGQAGSRAVLWGYIGIAVTPFVALALVPNFTDGWRVLFLIAAVGGLIVLPMRRRLPESPRWLIAEGRDDEALRLVEEAEEYAASQPEPSAPQELKPAVKLRPFKVTALLFFAIWLIYYVANYGWLTLAPTLLTDQGFTLSTSLTFLCVTGIGFVVGAAAAVRYSERFERKFSIAISLVVFALSLAVIGLFPEGPVIMAFGFIVSFTIGFAVPLMYVLTAEEYPIQTRARGVAIGDGLGHLGGAAAPLLILPAAAVGFFWGMGVMALAGLITVGLVLFSQRMTGRVE